MPSLSDSMAFSAQRRRLVRRAAAILALLIVGTVAVVDVGYGRLHPLERGSTWAGLRPCVFTTGTRCTLVPEPGVAYWYGQSVRNRGALPVVVDGLDSLDDGEGSALVRDGVRMDPDSSHGGIDEEAAIPFAPFTLDPGDERLLFMYEHVRDCAGTMPEGSNMVVSSWTLRFHLLLIGHQATVRLGERVLVPFNPCYYSGSVTGAGD
jgi:hypothetical protein